MANTLYDEVYGDFYMSKLMNDKSYTSYAGITDPVEIASLVEAHSLSLLKNSISMIYESGVPQIDFYDKDDIQFNNQLTDIEINLLNDCMYFLLMCENRNKLKILGLTFKSSELNLFSPANDRDSYEKMLKSIGDDVDTSIQSYLNRDRLTHKLKNPNQ
ncbi:MAG TPA: hypothetical protein VIM70_07965 [Clostridium sp.]|uniref:hypothetical protein n=1 Tax=Clostridium sp. TaxID=1506 RepID=UPI002F938B6E